MAVKAAVEKAAGVPIADKAAAEELAATLSRASDKAAARLKLRM